MNRFRWDPRDELVDHCLVGGVQHFGNLAQSGFSILHRDFGRLGVPRFGGDLIAPVKHV
ncbi:hypothetical protein [Gordonia sp. AC31]|uniref:hypothetical protein n=1 Tax=Gordonia sp. AC31 TaxID=2962571 RepID=UPI0037C199DD